MFSPPPPGAVVAVEQDVRRLVERAERVAERLHDALLAVLQLEQAAEVEVDAAGGARELLEEAAAPAGRALGARRSTTG